jgi:hypothetical protein
VRFGSHEPRPKLVGCFIHQRHQASARLVVRVVDLVLAVSIVRDAPFFGSRKEVADLWGYRFGS